VPAGCLDAKWPCDESFIGYLFLEIRRPILIQTSAKNNRALKVQPFPLP
jgi:hypothetical protein